MFPRGVGVGGLFEDKLEGIREYMRGDKQRQKRFPVILFPTFVFLVFQNFEKYLFTILLYFSIKGK